MSVALMKLRTLWVQVPSLGRTRAPLNTFAMVAASVSPENGYLPWNLLMQLTLDK